MYVCVRVWVGGGGCGCVSTGAVGSLSVALAAYVSVSVIHTSRKSDELKKTPKT